MDCCTLINTNQDLQEDNKNKEMDMSVHKGHGICVIWDLKCRGYKSSLLHTYSERFLCPLTPNSVFSMLSLHSERYC